MKRRRVTPSTAGGSVEASLESIVAQSEIAANLPRIPGLSMEHVPSFLHVLKTTSKFFQTEQKVRPFSVVDWETLVSRSNSRGNDGGRETTAQQNDPKSIHESIMDRVNAASNSSESDPTDKNHQKRFVQAVTSWLEEVQIHAKKRRRQESTSDPPQEQKATLKENVPVPYAMFLYLWQLQQDHKWLRVRRSALFLSGLLLLRSRDCRYHIHQENHLADWVSNIAIQLDGNESSNRKLVQLALLQKEAISLMTHLLDEGFGAKYIKLAVATKSLQHRCNTSVLETLDLDNSIAPTPQGMANWRKLRDFALVHGRKEIPKVAKLLDRADECLEILVPRIDGVRRALVSRREELRTGETHNDQKQGADNPRDSGNDNVSESDDDDIDWEDGDEIDANDTTQHLSAVEQTMAAMEKTAGSTLFTGGRLEIDFDKRLDDETLARENDTNGNQASKENQARTTLEKIVRRLSTRHLVRLSAWLDGLRNSDNLVLSEESASLVSLSPSKESLQLELIRGLSALKQDISTVLSSASRLNIKAQKQDEGVATIPTLSETNSATVPNGPSSLLPFQGMAAAPPARRASANGPAQKKSKQKKFRRIQINYNK